MLAPTSSSHSIVPDASMSSSLNARPTSSLVASLPPKNFFSVSKTFGSDIALPHSLPSTQPFASLSMLSKTRRSSDSSSVSANAIATVDERFFMSSFSSRTFAGASSSALLTDERLSENDGPPRLSRGSSLTSISPGDGISPSGWKPRRDACSESVAIMALRGASVEAFAAISADSIASDISRCVFMTASIEDASIERKAGAGGMEVPSSHATIERRRRPASGGSESDAVAASPSVRSDIGVLCRDEARAPRNLANPEVRRRVVLGTIFSNEMSSKSRVRHRRGDRPREVVVIISAGRRRPALLTASCWHPVVLLARVMHLH